MTDDPGEILAWAQADPAARAEEGLRRVDAVALRLMDAGRQSSPEMQAARDAGMMLTRLAASVRAQRAAGS